MKFIHAKSRLQLAKQELFDFIFIIDTNQLTNLYLQLASILLELTVLHYFYLNSNFTFLYDHQAFSNYFQSIHAFFIHIYPFSNPTYALLTLSLYPIVAVIALVIKKFGPNKLLVPIVQIAIYIHPLISVKIVIEMINAFSMGTYIYITLPLAVVNLAFGFLVCILSKKTYRMLEYPLILLFELHANIYLILIILVLRLLVVGYLLYPSNRNLLGYFFQCSMFIVLVTSYLCDDQFLNYIGFLFLVLAFLITGGNETRRAFAEERTILDFADQLEEEGDEDSIYEVYRRVEEHYVECDIIECHCQNFYKIDKEGLTQWIYHFEEQRLRRRESFIGRYEYAEKCWSHYDFRLSGLVRVCEGKALGIMEEYLTFKVCSIYELNLRKQDKNYRYGEPYQNAQEELQAFHMELSKILQSIRKFWTLITNFDGSTKFLNEILLISQSIIKLRTQYALYEAKYDDQLKQFKYTYELFLTLILNQEVAEQDEIFVPEPTAFVITNGQTILNANNSFLIMTSMRMETLIGTNYNTLIPDVYKDIHNRWAADFIETVEDYEDKQITKCLSVGNIEIKMVEMMHKVLPRFRDGLEIYTTVKQSTDHKKEKRETFIFLAEKETYYIKNVSSNFFDIIKFKVNQRNFKLLQEMSLTSIFESFSLLHSENPTREVTIFPHFLEEFTYLKSKKKEKKKAKTMQSAPRNSHLMGLTGRVSANGNENEQIYEFTILPNNRTQDPYVKVQFTLKEEKYEEALSSHESSLPNQEVQQHLFQKKQKKEDNFSFFIPYYLILSLGLCHILYILGRNSFDNAVTTLQSRYQFYHDYDYTTLYVLHAWTGIDRTEELRTLWIQGFGDFSESFNAFRRIHDHFFLEYFDSQITVEFHNQLFDEIQSVISKAKYDMSFYQIFLMIILLAVIGHYLFDLVLSLRYTFLIESKVGALLLQFVIIEGKDVREIMTMIENFEGNILNIQENKSILKVPIETVEQSALELLKGGGGGISLNNSMVFQNEQEETPSEKRHFHYRKRGISIDEKDRVSLSLMKSQFRTHEKGSFKKQGNNLREEYNGDKNRNINLFKRKYRSCGFIISANKFLFFLIFSGFLLSVGILMGSFIYFYTPLQQLPMHLQTLDSLEQSRTILLKSQTEILINSTVSLSPKTTLSETLLALIHLINSISTNTIMTSFNTEFNNFFNRDVCSRVNYDCNLIAGDSKVHTYGMKVIAQYLEDYFREKSKTSMTVSSLQNQLIVYSEVLFTQLITDFVADSQQYCSGIDGSEVKMVVIGSLGLLIGMILIHYSLREFKNRIENSRNLLQIIPKEIKKKQENEIEVLTLKEMSTP